MYVSLRILIRNNTKLYSPCGQACARIFIHIICATIGPGVPSTLVIVRRAVGVAATTRISKCHGFIDDSLLNRSPSWSQPEKVVSLPRLGIRTKCS